MKAKNHVIRADDDTLRRLKAEYDFIGRPCEIQGDKLVIFALPQKKVVQKQERGRGRRA
jgi:hypothetical protein